MNALNQWISRAALSLGLVFCVAPCLWAQPEEILKSRSAEANIVFGKIVRVHGHRLDIEDGKSARSVLLTPETVYEIDGKPITLEDLPPAARIRVFMDESRPDRAGRVIVLPQEPAVKNPPDPVLKPRMTETPSLPNAVETPTQRAANDLQSRTTAVVNNDPVPDVPIGATLETTTEGVRVVSVESDGVFAQSGFRPGDLLKYVGQTNVVTPKGVFHVLHQSPAGTTFPVTFIRGDEEMKTSLLLPKTFEPILVGRNQSNTPHEKTPSDQVTTPSIGWELGTAGNMIKILSVAPGSPAEISGLHAGDFISDINDQRVNSPDDLMELLRAQSGAPAVTLLVHRGENSMHRGLILPAGLTVSARKNATNIADENPEDFSQLMKTQQDQALEIQELQARVSSLRAELNALRQGNPSPVSDQKEVPAK